MKIKFFQADIAVFMENRFGCKIISKTSPPSPLLEKKRGVPKP